MLCISVIISNSNSNVDGQESDEESVVDVNVKKLPEIDSSAVKKKTYVYLFCFKYSTYLHTHMHTPKQPKSFLS